MHALKNVFTLLLLTIDEAIQDSDSSQKKKQGKYYRKSLWETGNSKMLIYNSTRSQEQHLLEIHVLEKYHAYISIKKNHYFFAKNWKAN